MIEATIGIALLLFGALLACQLVLVFHGALAAHTAATRTARTFAITGMHREAKKTFALQTETTLKALKWGGPDCHNADGGRKAQCDVWVDVPSVLPGAGLFTGGGLSSALRLTESGYYPIGDRSGY